GASDSENAAITATAVTDQATTAGGKVSIAADGSYTYTPPAGYDGADSFSYTGQTPDAGEGRDATINRNAAKDNDLGVGIPRTGTTKAVPWTTRVRSGASDSENAAITATAVTDQATTAGGKVSIAADGSYTYTPPAGYDGADSFS